MKKVLESVGVFLVAILITGCMNVKMVMKVNDDKSVDVNMTMELDLLEYAKLTNSFGENLTEEDLKKQLNEAMNSEDFNMDEFMDEEQRKEMESQGYKVDVILDKEKYIYRIVLTQHFNNIDDASKTEEEATKKDDNDKVINNFFIKTSNNTYKFDIDSTDNSSTETDSDINNSMNEMINNMASITYNYEITLPTKPISNNATKVSNDGKTLTWDLKANDKNKVEFEFAFPEPKEETKTPVATASTNNFTSFFKDMNNEKILALGLIVGGSLTLVIATIAYFTSNRKNK